jgi:hypothetical protein
MKKYKCHSELNRFVHNHVYKKGEGVVPAGGETGRPHCLAEVYKAVKKQRYILGK